MTVLADVLVIAAVFGTAVVRIMVRMIEEGVAGSSGGSGSCSKSSSTSGSSSTLSGVGHTHVAVTATAVVIVVGSSIRSSRNLIVTTTALVTSGRKREKDP